MWTSNNVLTTSLAVMYTMRKSAKRLKRKSNKKSYTFKRSRSPPRRSRIMRGGQSALFPVSFSNSDAAASPQSYLPYNNFSADPGYSVVNSRNTGDFLTGTTKGGRRKKLRGCKYNGGAVNILSNFSNSGSSYNSSAPVIIAPLA